MTETAIPPIPVICDACRATGMAGDEAFSAIPDILAFEPVQRRAHANGWIDGGAHPGDERAHQ